jgi:alpha-amylase
LHQLYLSFLIHAHQPVGNFEDVLERAYAQCYLPFVELLEKHPSVRLGLHYSGCLLEWMEQRRPEFFEQLRALVVRKQVEMVGGGFYEPILIAIPPQDRLAQLQRMAEFIERRFGQRPRGAWLAERVWEPQLPTSLAAAGVEYTLVDDIHFLAAGFEPEQLHGSYIAEDLGATVKLIPGLKKLRYTVPFASVEENIAYLREVAARHPGGLAAMGDDNEKFGIWPETFQHCYTNGWLERFFVALEDNSEWLVTVPPGEFISAHAPLGRADLPAASYTEMMEWALPTPARARFHAVQGEFSARPEVQAFLRGGTWRSFFSKYAESSLLHKKMLHVSGKLQRIASSTRRGLPLQRAVDHATPHLLRAQCNDAFWHGIFGGLYAPHLRSVLWRELICAEKLVDAAEHGRPTYLEVEQLDFDADGKDELYQTSESFAALWKPSDGATLAALDFRPSEVTLINSIQRRPEPYHSRLREITSGQAAAAVSIHEQSKVKEPGLDQHLKYDRWARHAFRLLIFPPEKLFADYERLDLKESEAFAAGEYDVVSAVPDRLEFLLVSPPILGSVGEQAPGAPPLRAQARKTIAVSRSNGGVDIACDLELVNTAPTALKIRAGLELVLNLLAPNADDRYFDSRDAHYPLRWSGELPAPALRMVDEWQNVALGIEAPGVESFWIAPIETVSESEDGFERVYQGSQILPHWAMELVPNVPWRARVTLRISTAR